MPYTDEKLGGKFGVDKNGVPVGFHWNVLRRFTDDEGKPIGEAHIDVPFTIEELREHIAPALTARDADIKADREAQDALKAQVKARDDALNAIKQAEARWTEAVAPHLEALAAR